MKYIKLPLAVFILCCSLLYAFMELSDFADYYRYPKLTYKYINNYVKIVALAPVKDEKTGVTKLKPVNMFSGTVLGKSGLILTCKHALFDYKLFRVNFYSETSTLAYVVFRSKNIDFALLKIIDSYEKRGFYNIKLKTWTVRGMPIYSVGNSGMLMGHFSQGHVVGYTKTLIITNHFVDFGFSGSGTFDINGRLVGMVVGFGTHIPFLPIHGGYTFNIPAQHMIKRINQHNY